MMIYFIKSTFLFLIFFLIYKGMLEKKKSSKFKRFYLLAAVTAGLFIPFLDFQFKVVHNSITETKQIVLNEIQNQIDFSNFVSEISLPIANKTSIILVVYVLICIVFGIRFLWNIDKLLFFKRTGKVVQNKYGILVLHEKIKSPFSFYDAIYLNEKQWNEKQIASEILYHEQGHLRQKHTLDILFVEFLKVFFWFQPFVFVMKRLIQENHEYLADEYSLMKTQNVKHYQQLILSFYNNQTNEMQLSSSFHFNNLKKRFIMMKNTKKGRLWETIFYSSAVLITYFGFVGIEAKATEIKNVETKVSEMIENSVKEPHKTLEALTETVSNEVLQKNDSEIPVLKYVVGQKTAGYLHNPEDDKTYYYVISPEKEVSIYNRYGVLQETKNFTFKLEEKSKEEAIREEIERKKAIEKEAQNNDGIVVLKFLKGKEHSGFFTDYRDDKTYYYVVSATKDVLIYDRYGVKQDKTNFTYKLEEKVNDEQANERFLKEEVEKKRALELEAQKRAGLGEIDRKAEYKEGKLALSYRIKNELKDLFPSKDTEMILNFIVEKDGSLSNLSVQTKAEILNVKDGKATISSTNNSSSKTMNEVLKIMNNTSTWNPAELKGEPVRSNYVMHITFLSNKKEIKIK